MKLVFNLKSISPQILVFFSVLLFSCNNSGDIEKTDLEKEGLKGAVVLLVDDSNPQYQTFKEFDEKGMLKIEFNSLRDGSFFIIREYEYLDDKLSLINIKSGFLSAINQAEKNVKRYYYDTTGKLIKTEQTGNPNFLTTYKYVEEQLTEEKTLADGKLNVIISYTYLDGDLKSNLLQWYANEQILLSQKVEFKDGKQVLVENLKSNLWKKYYEYDENGLLIKSTFKEGKKTTTELIDYLFDPNGNWIEKNVTTGGKSVIEKRKIYYRSENISFYLEKINTVKGSTPSNNRSDESRNSADQQSYSTPSGTSSSAQNSQSAQTVCNFCKGTGKCRECGKTFRKEYYKGNGSYDNRNESRSGLVICNDCWGRGHKQVKRSAGGWEPGEDCYIRDCNDGWVSCRGCNNYGQGKNPGQCKDCRGTGYRN